MKSAIEYAAVADQLRRVEDRALPRPFDRRASARIDRLLNREAELLNRLAKVRPTVQAEAR